MSNLHFLCSFALSEFRKSSEVVLESDSSSVITGAHKENNMNWQRSKSLDVLSNDNEPEVFSEQDGHVANRVSSFMPFPDVRKSHISNSHFSGLDGIFVNFCDHLV